MNKIIELYLFLKLVLFVFSLLLFIPFALAFPSYFLSGISGFLNRMLDDVLKYDIADKDEVEEYRNEIRFK